LTSVRMVVSGRVQGVWYRAWTQEQALSRDLSGWVRNCSDGTVEAVFSGSDDAVSSMLDAARNGPRLARVDDLKAEPCDPPEDGFITRPTK
jgi:acylphosphatase